MSKDLPLENKWIAITRPSHQVEKLQKKLVDAGANIILFPLLEITPGKPSLVQQQLKKLHDYDMVIFVSSNAVTETFKWIDAKALEPLKISAVGKKTAESLKKYGVKIDFCPEKVFNSEALLAVAGMKQFCQGKQITIIRGENGRDFLRNALLRIGAEVDYFNVYQRVCPQNSLDKLKLSYGKGELDIILFSSGESISNFFDLAKEQNWIHKLTLLLGSARMQKKIPEQFQGKLLTVEDPSDETLYQELIKTYG